MENIKNLLICLPEVMMTRFSIKECIAIGKSSHKTAKWSYLDHPVSTNPRKDNLLGDHQILRQHIFGLFQTHPLWLLSSGQYFITAVIDHMACYNLNRPRIKL